MQCSNARTHTHTLFPYLLFFVPKRVTGSNKFCDDWMQAFLNGAEGGNPFLFRQILENFKLKVTLYTHMFAGDRRVTDYANSHFCIDIVITVRACLVLAVLRVDKNGISSKGDRQI